MILLSATIFFHQKTLSYLSNLWTRENFLLVCIILYENFKNFGSSQNTYVLEGMIFIHQFFYLVPFPFYRYFFVFFFVYISFASGASINHVNRFWDLFDPSTKGLDSIIKILTLDIGVFSMKIEVRIKYLD